MNNSLSVIGLNSFYISLIILSIPILVYLPLLFLHKKISGKYNFFLQTFNFGFLVILASFGFLKEAYSMYIENFHNQNLLHEQFSIEIIISILGIIGGGLALGIMLNIFIRFIGIKISEKKGQKINFNDHDHSSHIINIADIENKNQLWTGIIILLNHKIVDGITIGFLIFESNKIFEFESLSLLIGFLIHIIPISISMYIYSLKITKNKLKIFLSVFLSQLITIPFIFMGSYLAHAIQNINWFLPLLFSISSGMLLMFAILEFIPEVIHNKNISSKKWYIAILWMSIGIILAVIISLIHNH